MTNPQKKKKKQEIIEVWTELKTKLITTLTELKANHKDQWAVVKSKSAIEQVDILPGRLEDREYCLREIKLMDSRPPKQMLSSTDQIKYDLLKERLKELTNQEKLDWLRELVKEGDWNQLQELVRQAKI